MDFFLTIRVAFRALLKNKMRALLTVLGVAALALWPIPRRAAWAFGVLAGGLLAVGRHNPFYEELRRAVPLLGMLRFPEKFAILAVASLAFARALGW